MQSRTALGIRTADTIALGALASQGTTARRVAAGVSRAARGGAGWAACSALLAPLGPRYRRAGVQGLAGWAVAEVAASGIKQLTDRRRPALPGRRGASTRTSSMPSSHTAAGVAYAVAAGIAAPATALPLGALATAVGWSRLSTKRHFPTDVAAAVGLGAVVGVGVALAARRVAPAEPEPT